MQIQHQVAKGSRSRKRKHFQHLLPPTRCHRQTSHSIRHETHSRIVLLPRQRRRRHFLSRRCRTTIVSSLQKHVTYTQLIARVLERHNVMRVSRDALGVFPRWKHVLTKVQDRDVSVMRMFGENVQDRLVVVSLRHEIVHDE